MTLVKSTVEQTGSAPLPLLATDLALVTRPGNSTKHAALQALLDLVLAQLVGDRGQVIVDGTGLGWSIDISGQTADASPDLTADYVMTWDQSAGVNKKVRLNVLLPDGSKGDIVVSSNNGVWTIASGAVSLAKLANMATASLLGRASAGSGSPEVLGVGGGLELVSSALRRAAITGDVAIAAGANTASLAKLVEYYATLATGITTGNAQPLSLADSIFTGKSAGGALNGNGTAGVVASSFASLGSETGTGASQGGLGSAASATQPYNATDFPGQRGALCYLAKQDGDQPLLIDMLSTATAADRDAPVYAYLSFRSDLGANLKWRLWFYYRRASDGLEVPFTPDTSLTNISIGVPIVDTMGNLPVSAFSGRPQFGQMAAAIGAKAIGTTQLDDLAATTAKVADQAITYAKLQNVSATARMLGRKTAGAGSAEELSLSDVLDLVGSAAQGDILYRGASAWVRLAAATAGQFFQTGGAGANPLWATPPNAVAGGAAGYLTGADKLKIDNGPANVSAGSSLTASVTVSNSTADTAILTFTAGASTLAAGAVFEFDVWGDSDNVVTAAPVLNFWVKDQGGTKRVTVSFTHTTTAKTNQGWHLSGQIDIRTLTATGTDRFSMKIETMTTATPTFAVAVNNADVTIDTTASHTFTLGMNWGTANAANIARAHLGYFVQIK